jgi:glycosyltransferase involved in cell wall biosynthesis/GNAT superfamily N-acetyltransferase
LRTAHLTTVDLSLRFLLLSQLEAALKHGEAIGISAPGEYVAELEARGVRHVSLPSSTRGFHPGKDLLAAWQLWRFLRRERIDILHTHNPKPGVYGRVVGRLAGVPIVINTVHGLYASQESPFWKKALVFTLEWLASRFSDVELVQNPEDLELLTSRRIVSRNKARYLGNGVDLKRFNPSEAQQARGPVRDELGLADGDLAVGFVGRLVEEKGIPELIEAVSMLDDRFVLFLVGPNDPEKADALDQEAVDRAEARGVRFLGMRQDPERLYGAFDVFVLPSHREGFPRAAMEAAASGLPVVATDIRGCRQVVEEGSNGLLFPVGDIEALASAVRRLGDDSSLRIHMAKNSRERAIELFDEDAVVEIVMSTYRDLAERKGLAWAMAGEGEGIAVRRAQPSDAAALAQLHRHSIGTGFLSMLGTGFLTVLYRFLASDSDSLVSVAIADETVVGFIAGTADTGALYRRFILNRWLAAGVRVFPRLLDPRNLKRVWESFRYGSEHTRAPAELLSMAVAPVARRRGVGRRLVEQLLQWSRARGLSAMTVVVASGNDPAIRLYNECGFVDGNEIQVHEGESSWEFLWSG